MGDIPGIIIKCDDEITDWSMELPDHLEAMRRAFSKGEGGKARVELRWKTRLQMEHVDRIIERVGKAGWDILDTELKHRLSSSERVFSPAVTDVLWTMRRNIEIENKYPPRVNLRNW
jgi:hypothetical protein